MGAVYFYHMTRTPLARTLPNLLEKSRKAGWRVLVRAPDAEGQSRIDDLLWTYDPGSFLPHGVDEDAGPQPILIGTAQAKAEGREALVSVLGADITVAEAQDATRAMILFDGDDDVAVGHARTQWRSLTQAGIAAQYWSDADGGWVKKAEAGGEPKTGG